MATADEQMRAFTRSVFGDGRSVEPLDTQPAARLGNHVPHEGRVVSPGLPTGEHAAREFVRELFG